MADEQEPDRAVAGAAVVLPAQEEGRRLRPRRRVPADRAADQPAEPVDDSPTTILDEAPRAAPGPKPVRPPPLFADEAPTETLATQAPLQTPSRPSRSDATPGQPAEAAQAPGRVRGRSCPVASPPPSPGCWSAP